MGQERLGPSYLFIPLVLGPLNSLVWYVPSLRYTRGLGWCMHCGVEVTESSTNKQHHPGRDSGVSIKARNVHPCPGSSLPRRTRAGSAIYWLFPSDACPRLPLGERGQGYCVPTAWVITSVPESSPKGSISGKCMLVEPKLLCPYY